MSSQSASNNQEQQSTDLGHKSSGTMFAGLQEQKRDPNNEASAARRTSLQEQSAKPKDGVIAGLWNSTFKGAPEK